MNLKIYEKTKYNNIYKNRLNGTYAVDLSLGYNSSGKRIRTTKTGILSEKEAKLLLASQDTKNKIKIQTVNKQKFEDYLDEYYDWCINFKKIKEETIRKKKSRFNNNMIPFFNGKVVSKINENDVIGWQRFIKSKDFTDETIKTLERQLCAYFNWLVKFKRIMAYNPYQQIEKIKTKKSEIEYRTIDEVKKLWNCIELDDKYPEDIKLRVIAITTLLFFCGFRFGELIGLRFRDIDFDLINETEINVDEVKIHIRETLYYGKGGYAVSDGKTSASLDTIYAGKNVMKSLLNYVKCMQRLGCVFNENDYIFINPDTEKVFSPETIRKQLNYYVDKSGIQHTKFKDLRSSHGTFLLSEGFSLEEVQMRLRHTKKETTEKYYATFYEENKKRLACDIDKYAA